MRSGRGQVTLQVDFQFPQGQVWRWKTITAQDKKKGEIFLGLFLYKRSFYLLVQIFICSSFSGGTGDCLVKQVNVQSRGFYKDDKFSSAVVVT